MLKYRRFLNYLSDDGMEKTLNQVMLAQFLRGEVHPMTALMHVCQIFGFDLGK